MSAALSAREQGASVCILSKQHPLRSHSSGAHSGINAGLRGDNAWESHGLDTVMAGAYLSDQDVVEAICQEAAARVIGLEHMGVPFDRNAEGRIHQTRFPASSEPRTCYCADATGHNILNSLFEQVLRMQIPLFYEWSAVSLITMDDGSCQGVFARNLKDGTLAAYSSEAVVLATGGNGPNVPQQHGLDGFHCRRACYGLPGRRPPAGHGDGPVRSNGPGTQWPADHRGRERRRGYSGPLRRRTYRIRRRGRCHCAIFQ